MVRLTLLTAAAGSLFAVAPAPAPGTTRPPGHTKQQAEVNLLRAVPRLWNRSRIPALVDAKTHLLADNTEAVCQARSRRLEGNRYIRFECVVRPRVHRLREGLYVSYRVLLTGGTRIHWLTYIR